MDEQEFDALFSSRPFGTQYALRKDARASLCHAGHSALWQGSRRSSPSTPRIPSGNTGRLRLADFHDLQRHLEMVTAALNNPRNSWLSPLGTAAFGLIEVGSQQLSIWEARIEILRRAIRYLENR